MAHIYKLCARVHGRLHKVDSKRRSYFDKFVLIYFGLTPTFGCLGQKENRELNVWKLTSGIRKLELVEKNDLNPKKRNTEFHFPN